MLFDPSRRGFLKGGLIATATTALTARAARAETPSPIPSADQVPVTTTVNGEAVTMTVHPDESSLEAIRRRLGLTGAKEGCGHGACGACTMLVDGEPHATCLLPAVALQGADVTTVEGLSADGLLPIQRAFLANDALQCGYCTPGFIVEASAFVDAWRTEHGDVAPDRDTIAHALAGHLCRCGAYVAIYEAVSQTCEGRFDGEVFEAPRADGREKVTGEAKYTVDVQLDGQLDAAVLRSPHGHATLTGLDLSAARAMAGVKAVIPLTEVGHKVRFAGQEIAAVAATDPRTAQAALHAIVADYDVLPVVVGFAGARNTDLPALYAERKEKKGPPNASEGPLVPAKWAHNLRGPTDSSFFARPRKAITAVESAQTVLSETFTTQVQCHTALEPHAAVAHWTTTETVTVHLSTQSCTWMAEDIAERWGLKRGAAIVLCPFVGGGFGAKATLQMEAMIAVELAKQAGAPVRVANSRSEELIVGGNRPATELTVDFALDGADLAAVQARALSDAGCAAGNNTGLLLRVMYPSLKSLEDFDALTNGPPGKPFRGPGGPPAFFALEQMVDAAAIHLDEDPIALRKRWDPNPARQKLLDWAGSVPQWAQRSGIGADTGRYRRGIGLASSAWFVLLTPDAHVQIDASAEGIVASSACQDMGNGSKSVVAWEIARVMGISPSEVTVKFGDSRSVHGPLSGGSRTSASIGPAAAEAADRLIAELVDFAGDALGLSDVVAEPGGVAHSGGTMRWSEILAESPRVTVVGRRRLKDDPGYLLPFTVQDLRVIKAIAGAVQLTALEVDT
ncbi:MAG: xanthine dehydrogenase YagR molybdenum-binding subunit, partial [Myxococcota bacterium]